MDLFKNSTSFSPASGFQKAGKSTLAPTSFSEKTAYYSLPDECPEETKLLFAKYLAYCGTSEVTNLFKWKSWITTWVCVITPAFASRLPPINFRKIEVGAQALPNLVKQMGDLERALDAEDRDAVDLAGAAISDNKDFPLLPPVKAGINFGLGNGEWTGKVALCYYALVIFLAGKRIEGDDHSQITDARPKALRGKAHITEPLDFLEGDLRISDKAHLSLNNAWSELGQLRGVVFREYASYDSDESDTSKDIIWTSMHLLRYSNMAHALITFNFLRAFPWATEVPALMTSIAIYTSSLKEAEKIEPKMFPFIKLIYGDKSGLFPRKEMEPLIACAKDALESTNSTLSDFYTNAAFNPIVEAFREERARRENIRDLHLQKREKELTDFFTPDESTQIGGLDTPATAD